jgi:hypothetical protein
MKPHTGLPEDVVPNVIVSVEDIVEDRYLKKFSIGITGNTESRRSELGADDVVPVYKTSNTDDAVNVEEALLDVFRKNPGYSIEVDDGSIGVPSEREQYVYIAVWLTDKLIP